MKKCFAALPLAVLLSLVGCGSPNRPIDQQNASAASMNSDMVVVDVRTPEEYAEGHVKGSTNVPVGVIAERIEEVVPDKSREVAVYCRTGRRSSTAAELLKSKGYKVRDLATLDNARTVLEK